MDNQQLYPFTREQLQVFLSARLGDGHIQTTNSNSTFYSTNCVHKEYIDFKKSLLGDMFKAEHYLEENGYCKTPIYIMRSCSNPALKVIKNLPIKEVLSNLDDLGIALWVYDDGSLHKDNLFYNLNTHSFSKEIQEDLFIPFFNNLGIYPVLRKEQKKDGRLFYYLCINKLKGAATISSILDKYPVNCFSYKRWSSETIQKWSKLQEKLKSENIEMSSLHPRTIGKLLKDIEV